MTGRSATTKLSSPSLAYGGLPLRQTFDLDARKRGIAAQPLGRIAVTLLPKVYSYLSSPVRRAAARSKLSGRGTSHGKTVDAAYSLACVYEAQGRLDDAEIMYHRALETGR